MDTGEIIFIKGLKLLNNICLSNGLWYNSISYDTFVQLYCKLILEGDKDLTYKLKRYIWICPVLWMIIIFLFSHQPGNQSAHLSGSLTQFLVRFFEIISIELDWIRLH